MDKLSYALGMSVAQNLRQSGANDLKVTDFCKAIKTAFGDKEEFLLTAEEAGQVLEEFFQRVETERKEKYQKAVEGIKAGGERFLEDNKNLDGVVTLPSGLQYKVIVEGNGAKPTATSTVECHYEGRLINGNVFDSSYQRGESVTFNLNQVIPGWTEGLQLMREGSKYELYIPYQLGYGENGVNGVIPPFAPLVFTVELLSVK